MGSAVPRGLCQPRAAANSNQPERKKTSPRGQEKKRDFGGIGPAGAAAAAGGSGRPPPRGRTRRIGFTLKLFGCFNSRGARRPLGTRKSVWARGGCAGSAGMRARSGRMLSTRWVRAERAVRSLQAVQGGAAQQLAGRLLSGRVCRWEGAGRDGGAGVSTASGQQPAGGGPGTCPRGCGT